MSITMGNDEFILYVRKHNRGCKLQNDVLGRKIYEKIRELDPNAKIVEENRASYWDQYAVQVAPDKLPRTAAQFEFDRKILPDLYTYLDDITQ